MRRTIARGLGYGREVPQKNLLKIYGLMFVIAVIAVVIVTIVVMATGASSATTDTSHTAVDRSSLVRIQVRAPKRATVVMNNRPKGQAPMMLLVPRSDTPIDISVTLGGQILTKHVTPHEDIILDFP